MRAKEYIFGGDAFCKSHISLPNATTLCAGSFYFFTIFIKVRFSSRMQGPLKGRSRRWVPQLVQSERGGNSKSLLLSLYKPPALC